jgi:hypothetical protein
VLPTLAWQCVHQRVNIGSLWYEEGLPDVVIT